MKERIKEFAELAGDDWDYTLESDKQFLHKFANLVAAYEREKCAKVCEDSVEYAADELARQIRARTEK